VRHDSILPSFGVPDRLRTRPQARESGGVIPPASRFTGRISRISSAGYLQPDLQPDL
jgi:hypothetical protein